MSASSEYWKNREERQKRLYQISEDEYQARVKDIYDNMVVNINKEIYGFYGKYAKGEGIPIDEARKRISRLDMDEYEAKAKKYVKERDFSKQANEELRLYNTSMKINRLELLKANIGLEMVDGFDQLQKEFDADLTERAYKEFRRQAGILGKSVENTAQKATSIVNASFMNATFSDRIWMYQGMMKDRLSTLLTQGLVQGKGSIMLAKDLTKAFGVSRSDAERLMRTELARVQTAAQEESYKAADIDQYEYIGGQPNVCPICAELDGKRFPVKAMMPGTNAPPMHPNCKCSTAAYVGRERLNSLLQIKNADKSVEILQELESAKEIPIDIKESISSTINSINQQYDGIIQEVEYAPYHLNPKAPYTFIPYNDNGMYKAKLNINTLFSWNDTLEEFNERIYNKNYITGVLASKTAEDLLYHEAAHFLTFRGCETYNDLEERERELRPKFIRGVSGYSDAMQDGAETIAEAFVKIRNGEVITKEVKNLLKEYIGVL